jgi:phage terminase small subunit
VDNDAPNSKDLTNQQLLFIHELSTCKRSNVAAAARKAGYEERNAATHGWKLLHHPDYKHVQEAYHRLVDARMARYQVTEEALIRELAALAFADKRDVATFGPNGITIAKHSDEMWPEEVAQIKGLTQVETEFGTHVNISFYSKLEALVALAKIRGMLREKTELTIDLRIQTAARRATASLQALIEREAQEDPEGSAEGSAGG